MISPKKLIGKFLGLAKISHEALGDLDLICPCHQHYTYGGNINTI